ncbi:GPW/gp25 family protein [Solibacillus sp.]|uniref:GPW/gp25 family protein n=1 Tax=Solibacillus sp. TaxID=1909654 RepID=UPI0033150486
MSYEVSPKENIDFGATGVDEVLQNVAFILSTPIMSCTLDRDFGWRMGIDDPIQLRKARYTYEVTEAIQKFEPRAIVESIGFEETDELNGKLRPKVRIGIDVESL